MYFVVHSIQISSSESNNCLICSLLNALLPFGIPNFKTEALCLVSNVQLVKRLYGNILSMVK